MSTGDKVCVWTSWTSSAIGRVRMERWLAVKGERYALGRVEILEARSFCLRVLVAVLVWTEERLWGESLPGSPVVEDVEGV